MSTPSDHLGPGASLAPSGPRPLPLKVLIIVARDAGNPRAAGGDLHLSLLAQELSRAGHTVHVWCSATPSGPRREIVEGTTFERLAPARLLAPVVWVRLLSGAASSYDLVLEEVIGGERTPFLARFLSGRPCIGMWYQDNRPLFAAAYAPLVARAATALQSILLRTYRSGYLLTPSDRTRQWLISVGVSPDHIAVHHPKVISGVESASRPAFRNRRNRFVCVGNFRQYKRFEEAVAVLERLQRDVPDAELVLMGREDDARYLAYLRRRVAESPVHEHITIRVNATESEKFETFLSAKALTIHSPIEGFGWTIPEAGLCGVPTVANYGTPPEALAEGINGVRVAQRDIDAYAGALRDWMLNEGEWNRLSESAVQYAHRFVESGLPTEIEDFLHRVADQVGASDPATKLVIDPPPTPIGSFEQPPTSPRP